MSLGALVVIICTATSPVLLIVCVIITWLDDIFYPAIVSFFVFGTCVALQTMCIIWAFGSYLLNYHNSIEFFGINPIRYINLWYSLAFLLNAILAGVRCKWEAWPWKDNNLFSRKMGP